MNTLSSIGNEKSMTRVGSGGEGGGAKLHFLYLMGFILLETIQNIWLAPLFIR